VAIRRPALSDRASPGRQRNATGHVLDGTDRVGQDAMGCLSRRSRTAAQFVFRLPGRGRAGA
jgi:hypothetical protein